MLSLPDAYHIFSFTPTFQDRIVIVQILRKNDSKIPAASR